MQIVQLFITRETRGIFWMDCWVVKVSPPRETPQGASNYGLTQPYGSRRVSMIIQICSDACQTSPTTLVKISIKTNKPKQTSQHQRTGAGISLKPFQHRRARAGCRWRRCTRVREASWPLPAPPTTRSGWCVPTTAASPSRSATTRGSRTGASTAWRRGASGLCRTGGWGLFEILWNDKTAFQSFGLQESSPFSFVGVIPSMNVPY